MTSEPPSSPSKQPLSGLRIVEYGRFVSAPFASKLLADLGADVIKVEDPTGDPSRHRGPFPHDVPSIEASAEFLYVNTNKRGVTLNLDTPIGQSLLRELLADADVFIENAEPGVMERRGLTAARLCKTNPRLIAASIRPFGLSGPYRDYIGSDLVTWHASALGHRYLGEPDREPLRAGGYFASFFSATAAAAATMLALQAREVTGRGQRIEISEAEALAIGILGYGLIAIFYETGEHNKRLGGRQRGGVPAAMLSCKDGYVFVFASEAHMWEGLVKAMGEPEWAKADIFKGHYRDRARYGPEIYAMMQEWLDVTGKEEIFLACQENRVPSTAVYNMAEVLHNTHLRERGFWMATEHPAVGITEQPGAPYHFNTLEWEVKRPAPTLGESNEAVLCGLLGVSKIELTGLARTGVL